MSGSFELFEMMAHKAIDVAPTAQTLARICMLGLKGIMINAVGAICAHHNMFELNDAISAIHNNASKTANIVM